MITPEQWVQDEYHGWFSSACFDIAEGMITSGESNKDLECLSEDVYEDPDAIMDILGDRICDELGWNTPGYRRAKAELCRIAGISDDMA